MDFTKKWWWLTIFLLGLIIFFTFGFIMNLYFQIYSQSLLNYLSFLPFFLWILLCTVLVRVYGSENTKEVQKTAIYPFLSFLGFISFLFSLYATTNHRKIMLLITMTIFYLCLITSTYLIQKFFRERKIKIPWGTSFLSLLLGFPFAALFSNTIIRDKKLKKYGIVVPYTLAMNLLLITIITIVYCLFIYISFLK